MKIYTKMGDCGMTDTCNARISKGSDRICVLGELDEASAFIEAASAFLLPAHAEIEADLDCIRQKIFQCCADIAVEKGEKILAQDVSQLEARIDALTERLPKAHAFVSLGKNQHSMFLNIARTVVRRAERTLCKLPQESVNPLVYCYINRLSDYLYTAARYVNAVDQLSEIEYK